MILATVLAHMNDGDLYVLKGYITNGWTVPIIDDGNYVWTLLRNRWFARLNELVDNEFLNREDAE